MAKKEDQSVMVYAYFRFYADEEVIDAGLSKFCIEFSKIVTGGYNYKEYVCRVHNVGGMAKWLQTQQGYMKFEQEIGFMDAAPSDHVIDHTAKFGVDRLTSADFRILNGVKRGSKVYVKSLIGMDSGTSHVIKMVCGDETLVHPVMYTFDSSKIEILDLVDEVVDYSTVDEYEFQVDLPTPVAKGGVEYWRTPGLDVYDFNQMVDRDGNTYGYIHTAYGMTVQYLDIDMEQTFISCYIKAYNTFTNTPNAGRSYIYLSDDGSTWDLVRDSAYVNGEFYYINHNLPKEYRYIRFGAHGANINNRGNCRAYQIIVS